jgi:hypothetical protein
MIYKNVISGNEIGAALKLCIITETYLQNDSFKSLKKNVVKTYYQALSTALNEQSMKRILGPRAL